MYWFLLYRLLSWFLSRFFCFRLFPARSRRRSSVGAPLMTPRRRRRRSAPPPEAPLSRAAPRESASRPPPTVRRARRGVPPPPPCARPPPPAVRSRRASLRPRAASAPRIPGDRGDVARERVDVDLLRVGLLQFDQLPEQVALHQAHQALVDRVVGVARGRDHDPGLFGGELERFELAVERLAVAGERGVTDVIATLAEPARKAAIVGESAHHQAAVELGAQVGGSRLILPLSGGRFFTGPCAVAAASAFFFVTLMARPLKAERRLFRQLSRRAFGVCAGVLPFVLFADSRFSAVHRFVHRHPSPVLARARDPGRRRRRVFDHVDSARGQPRVPGLVVFALDLQQPAVAQVAQLAAQRVERDRELDIGEHAPHDSLRNRNRASGVEHAQDPPAGLFALLLLQVHRIHLFHRFTVSPFHRLAVALSHFARW